MKKKVRFQDQPTLNWQYRAAVAKEVNRLTKIQKDLFSLSSTLSLSSTQDRRWDSSVSPTTPPQARPSSQIMQTSSSSTLSDDLRQLLLGEISSSSSLGASSSVRMNDKSSKSNRNNYSPPSIPLRKESTDSLRKAIVGGEKGPSSSSSSSSSSPSIPTVTTPYSNIYITKRNHSFSTIEMINKDQKYTAIKTTR